MENQAIEKLISRHPERSSLEREFYSDPDIYQRDVERIYLRCWLYAGHLSEIPRRGDWLLFDMADESLIVVRGGDGEVNALLNVCRHRGSRICLERRGSSRTLVCRYHGWSYGLDGRLRAAAHMAGDFDKSAVALQRIHVELLEGMIFINFSEHPAPFSAVREALAGCLRPYGLERARVAHRQTYCIEANWKLSVENYTECYHCAPSHPEYTRGHSLARPGARSGALMAEVMSRARDCGLSEESVNRVYLDEPAFGSGFAFERYPLWHGHVTGSDDGRPVAPLLGAVSNYDGGATDFQVGPVSFGLAYCDYVVIYRFTPVSAGQSQCDISWLVDADAREGEDYQVPRLTWLWDVTTAADKRIIEHNAAGVRSRYYRPGPHSQMEDYTWKFTSWYLQAIR